MQLIGRAGLGLLRLLTRLAVDDVEVESSVAVKVEKGGSRTGGLGEVLLRQTARDIGTDGACPLSDVVIAREIEVLVRGPR